MIQCLTIQAFQIWSQTAAHRDNERAQKRYVPMLVHIDRYLMKYSLKTRLTYVQLSEEELENKKRNCEYTQNDFEFEYG